MSTKISVKGFVESHPKFIDFPTGGTVVTFSMVVESHEKAGVKKGICFDVEARNELGAPVYDCVQKGSGISIDGWFTVTKYTNNSGKQKTKRMINMHSFTLDSDPETKKYLAATQAEAHRIALSRAFRK